MHELSEKRSFQPLPPRRSWYLGSPGQQERSSSGLHCIGSTSCGLQCSLRPRGADWQPWFWRRPSCCQAMKRIYNIYNLYNIYNIIYIYMGSGRFPGPMELLLQQLVRVSKTRWRWFNLSNSTLLQPLIKKLEVLVMINQWTTYCMNDNNDERWMVVLIDFYLTFCTNKSCLIKC